MLKRLVEIGALGGISWKNKGGAFMISACLGMVMAVAVAVALQTASAFAADESLDYGLFKSRVEPIFLKKRAGHVRCYVCHEARSGNAFRLEKLSPGSTSWSEEQSRRNFQMAAALVVPGDPAKSRLLLQSLAPEAGGNSFHSGGRQFSSKSDPDWKILAQWVSGRKQASLPGK